MDASSDLYSVGMVLYEMVTGMPAFTGDNVFQVMNRVAHEPVVAPSVHNPELDEKLEAIILKSIGKRKEERYPDAATMRTALKEYLGGARRSGRQGHAQHAGFPVAAHAQQERFPRAVQHHHRDQQDRRIGIG